LSQLPHQQQEINALAIAALKYFVQPSWQSNRRTKPRNRN